MSRWGSRQRDTAPLEDLRLALQAIRSARDLSELLDQVCVGVARVTGAKGTAVAFERADGFEVVAAVGRAGRSGAQALVRKLHLAGAIPNGNEGEDDPLVVPLPTELGTAILVAQGAPRSRAALTLLGEAAGPLIDLHTLRTQAASAAHRIQPKERVAGLLASLRAGDAVAVVGLDHLAEVGRRSGQIAIESVVTAVGVHLLNATRPPGDTVAEIDGHRFFVVLRDLKAPVEAVAHRVLGSWTTTNPSTTLSIGAALHLDGIPPIDTLADAEAALASAQEVGGGQAHVTAVRRA